MHPSKMYINSAFVIAGVSAVSVAPSGELIGCEEVLGRPRLSTFSPQHLSPGGYSPNHYTASLRHGSNSRPIPVSSPVTPSASLPRGQHLCHGNSHFKQSTAMTSQSPEISSPARRSPLAQLPVKNMTNNPNPGGCSPKNVAAEPVVGDDACDRRTSVCSVGGDSRSELDLRTEVPDVRFSNNIPVNQTLDAR